MKKKNNLIFLKDYTFLIDKPFAHRGLHSKITKENSLAAFKKAIAFDFGIELDVRLSKDKKIIIFHDYLLKTKPIEKLTYKEILEIDSDIPLLEDALRLISGKVPVIIELKNTTNNNYLCQKVKELLYHYQGMHAIGSFNINIVNWFKKYSPDTPRGITSSYINEGFLRLFKNSLKKAVKKTKPQCIYFKIKDLPNYYISKLRDSGMIVLGWTARNQKEFEYALDYSDNVIFEGFLPKK